AQHKNQALKNDYKLLLSPSALLMVIVIAIHPSVQCKSCFQPQPPPPSSDETAKMLAAKPKHNEPQSFVNTTNKYNINWTKLYQESMEPEYEIHGAKGNVTGELFHSDHRKRSMSWNGGGAKIEDAL
ncbi:hypothetical protein TELCIR_12336, partial [Teladorsagia circumcincta]